MKKKLLFALLALMAITFSSCNSGNDDYELNTQQNFTQCFAHFTNSNINSPTATYTSSPVTVYLEVFYGSQTCNINISGLKRPDGTSYPSLTFESVKWTDNGEGWGICNEMNPKVSSSVASDLPAISDLRFRWSNREKISQALGTALTVCNYSFSIDEYMVYGSRCEQIIAGETVSTAEGVEPFKSDYPIYTILLKFETMTADIRLTNSKFAAAMPLMQMDFPDVPFSISDYTGEITLNAESLIPTIKGVPYPSFPITELKGELLPNGKCTLTFNCGVHDVTYNVKANLDINAVPNTDF